MVPGLGVELAVVECGSGPAVVLVHGMADAAAGWAPVAEALAAHARVIAYDRRGYGDSEAPEPYARTTVEEQAEDAACLMEARGAAGAGPAGRHRLLRGLRGARHLARHPRRAARPRPAGRDPRVPPRAAVPAPSVGGARAAASAGRPWAG